VTRSETKLIVVLLRRLLTGAAAAVLTLAIFMVLPLMQTISAPPGRDTLVRGIETADLPPPPPPPPEQEEEDEKPPEPPPELANEAPPLELSELELALNPGFGEGLFGDFQVRLAGQLTGGGGGEDLERVFSLADLDQKPRVLIQTVPRYPPEMRRKKVQGTVYMTFLVDRSGRVVEPAVEKSTNPAFDGAAMEAVRQWKFEPGTRQGEKVQFKMRIPITFNAG
jgi:protein TonB